MKKLLFLLILYFIPTGCFGIEETQKINLQQAIDITIENNLDIKVTTLDSDIANNNCQSEPDLQLQQLFRMGWII